MKRLISASLFILVTCYMTAMANAASGYLWYVKPGTSGGPWCSTIQEAINKASAGNSIMIWPGTYNEHLVINKNMITIYSAGSRDDTIIVGNGNYGSSVVEINSPDVRISGVTITIDVNRPSYDTYQNAIYIGPHATNTWVQDISVDSVILTVNETPRNQGGGGIVSWATGGYFSNCWFKTLRFKKWYNTAFTLNTTLPTLSGVTTNTIVDCEIHHAQKGIYIVNGNNLFGHEVYIYNTYFGKNQESIYANTTSGVRRVTVEVDGCHFYHGLMAFVTPDYCIKARGAGTKIHVKKDSIIWEQVKENLKYGEFDNGDIILE